MTIEYAFVEHASVIAEAARVLPDILGQVAEGVAASFERGNTLFACGNGGSAADAEHLVAELVGRFRLERKALAAVALTGAGATLTALANDYGYDRVFARQVDALARPGDILIAFSTSGNSPNIVEAARSARARGCSVFGFTGADGGRLRSEADLVVAAPSSVVARIQEVHAVCIHAMVEAVEHHLHLGLPP